MPVASPTVSGVAHVVCAVVMGVGEDVAVSMLVLVLVLDVVDLVLDAAPWSTLEDGVNGVPALMVKLLRHRSNVNSPEPEHVKSVLPSCPGHRLILLNAPLLTISCQLLYVFPFTPN